MLALAQQIAANQLRNLGDDIKLVIIHPNYFQQHRILSQILDTMPSVYVRFEGTPASAAELHTQLESAVSEQQVEGRYTLVLDECDRAPLAVFDEFVSQLLVTARMQRVMIFSRVVPTIVLEDGALRTQTSFLPSDRRLMLWDYARSETAASTLLEVRALGAGRVLLNGKPVDDWDGVLPRSLFFYLVDRGMTTRAEIFETFWPNLSVREATNVFHVTKRKISEVLGLDLTVYWSSFYHISPNIQLSYDAALFSELVQDSAVVEPEEASLLLRSAIGLYRGEFLTSIDMKWAEKRRQELVQTYGEALIGLAKVNEHRDDDRNALGLYLRAAQTNPQREDLALSVMRIYRELKMNADALTIYHRLQEELNRSLGVAPAPQLQELAAEIASEISADRQR